MSRNRMIREAAVAAAATLFLAACTAGGAGISGGGGGGDASLRYAFFAPIESFPGVQMEEWAERLNQQTNTEVSVDMFAGGTLLGSGDIFDGVSEGVTDVGMDSPAYDVNRFPLSSVVTLPLGFQCSRSASVTMLDLLQEYDTKEFEGYKIITAFTTEPAYIQSKQPVTSMPDLAGFQLRTSGALTPALRSLGASPVGLPMPEVAQSLQTGVISGYASSREVLKDFGLANQVGYITDYAFGVSNTFVAVMNQDRFDNLPKDVRQAIEDLRPKMTKFASTYHDKKNVRAAVEWAESKKDVETVQLDDGEKQKWDSHMESLIDDWRKQAAGNGFDPQQVLNRAQELADKYSGLCQQD